MKILQIFFLLVLVVLSSSQNHSIFYDFNEVMVELHARSYQSEKGLNYDWPCSRIEFCFKNADKVYWHGVDTFNFYNIVIDGTAEHVIKPSKNIKTLIYDANNSSAEKHCISLVKITENHYGPLGSTKDSLHIGIELEGKDAQILKNQKTYFHQFEFLGDSFTTAFGDLSTTNPKCMLHMRKSQSCLKSWAVLLSEHLNADYRLMAGSGKGCYINAPGIPGKPMPNLFTRITSNSKANSYTYQDNYRPEAIFFYIGGNDYANLKEPNRDRFIKAYIKMLKDVLKVNIQKLGNYPKLINVIDNYKTAPNSAIREAVSRFKYQYQRTYLVEIPDVLVKGDFGCIGHPNSKGYNKMAKSIQDQVARIIKSEGNPQQNLINSSPTFS